MAVVVEVEAEEVEVVEGEAEEAPRQVAQLREEETQNFSERNHPHSTGIAKMLTDSYQISKDICR